ncbi:MAG: hypothetical protein ACFCAD_01620 [Pleurocapsa sp.]
MQAINPNLKRKYLAPFNHSSYLSFFYRYSPECIGLVKDDGRTSMRRISPPIGNDFILVALHLPSKLRMKDEEQVFECVSVIQSIEEAETRVGHDRTLVIGDFNMNPFETGMVSAGGFHAVMDRNEAVKSSRKVQGKECKYFYNPMWRVMGNDTNDCLGSYYYRGGRLSYFWNTFDQVLLRPSLLDYFKSEDVSIISSIGSQSLIKNNKIDQSFSDHLPILIKLDIERIN